MTYVFRLFEFWIFFAFPFSPFLVFLLQWLTFYWACLRLKSFWESVIETGNFKHGAARCSGRKFWSEFFLLNFLSIFVHISGSLGPITLIWASLERYFPPAEVEYSWCQFWSKVMTPEEEERPRLVTAGYGWHRSQWVNEQSIVQVGVKIDYHWLSLIFINCHLFSSIINISQLIGIDWHWLLIGSIISHEITSEL